MTKFNKYTFRKYSKDFPNLFRKERTKLRKILTKDSKIEHCGSTAIIGMGGKGIIDIFISVNKRYIKKNRNRLEKAGYIFRSNAGNKDRQFFEKEYIYLKSIRRIHLHLTSHNSFEIRRAVSFVKYMNTHPNKIKKYEEIKKSAVQHAKGKGSSYRTHKKQYLNKLSKETLKEFNKHPHS